MTIRRKTTVLPGGGIQLDTPELPWGAEAEVVITVDDASRSSARSLDPNARPFWEDLLAIAAEIPEEELEKIPTDLAKNVDHYLYGAPKEEE